MNEVTFEIEIECVPAVLRAVLRKLASVGDTDAVSIALELLEEKI